MATPIYLDYNATTPHDPEVIAAMRPFLETEFGNPSSSHSYGIIAKNAVETARCRVAALLGCLPQEIVFTSGGTESVNFAIKGIAGACRHKGDHIITSRIEHPAVLEVCRYLERQGIKTTYLPVDREGIVSLSDLEKLVHGAGQEMEKRAGTENVLEIVGLGKACDIIDHSLSAGAWHMQQMRDQLVDGLCQELPQVRLNGHPHLRLPNTLSISFKNLEANRILEAIGQEVAASAGAACHSGTVEVSHVLKAMNVPLEWARGTLRFSTGRMTTDSEINRAVQIIVDRVKRLSNTR